MQNTPSTIYLTVWILSYQCNSMVTRYREKRLVIRVTKYELVQLQRKIDNRVVSNSDVLEGGWIA